MYVSLKSNNKEVIDDTKKSLFDRILQCDINVFIYISKSSHSFLKKYLAKDLWIGKKLNAMHVI